MTVEGFSLLEIGDKAYKMAVIYKLVANMKNRVRKIIWSITIVFLLFGLLPYKMPQFNINNENELLIYSPECTCCPEFYI
jgi:hypothetical protein